MIIGGGVGGIAATVRAQQAGLSVLGLDAGSDFGGTWLTNRYPGARCDVESVEYSFGFDDDLANDWSWSERFAGQPEILRYLHHVVERFSIRERFRFSTAVDQATFDSASARWTVVTECGTSISCRFLISATGGHSVPKTPQFPGADRFKGLAAHTSLWPDDLDTNRKRVAVIGTGPSGIQCVPELASSAEQVFVLQRTPNYVVPAHNGPRNVAFESLVKADYRDFRRRCSANAIGIGAEYVPSRGPSHDFTDAEVVQELRERWEEGGFTFVFAFDDMGTSLRLANIAGEMIRDKIAETVHDSETASLLSPHHVFGARRLCLGSSYYESFNEPNVELVDLSNDPIARLNEAGLVLTSGRQIEVDVIVYATGFEDQTAALRRIDIRGPAGSSLTELWAERPVNYLGMMVSGLPNFFMVNGPGSPSITTNMIANAEHNVDWIFRVIELAQGHVIVDSDPAAQQAWSEIVDGRAEGSLIFHDASRFWSTATDGTRFVLPYMGVSDYLSTLRSTIANGFADCIGLGTVIDIRDQPDTELPTETISTKEPSCATSFSSLQ